MNGARFHAAFPLLFFIAAYAESLPWLLLIMFLTYSIGSNIVFLNLIEQNFLSFINDFFKFCYK